MTRCPYTLPRAWEVGRLSVPAPPTRPSAAGWNTQTALWATTMLAMVGLDPAVWRRRRR